MSRGRAGTKNPGTGRGWYSSALPASVLVLGLHHRVDDVERDDHLLGRRFRAQPLAEHAVVLLDQREEDLRRRSA